MNFSDKTVYEYRINANKTLSFICRFMMVLFCCVGLLNYFGIFKIDDIIYPVLVASLIIMFLPTIIFDILHMDNLFVRMLVLTFVTYMSGMLYAVLSYHVIIMLVFPIAVSCLYCDRKSVVFTTILGIPTMVISHIIAFYLKVVPDEPLVTMHGVIFYGILPRVLEYLAVAIICFSLSNKFQKLISSLVNKNNQLYDEQKILITSLSDMIEGQSQETGQHVKRVSEYTKILCMALGMDDEEVWMVSMASMMHDVGKILVPREIIEKPGKLTEEEFAIMKKHVKYGRKLLEKSPGELMKLSAEIAYEHHERYDGTGYMNKKGEDISLYARCVSIADVFDALVSWRPYKEPWTPEKAREEILSQAGRQFDPQLVELFDKHFDEFLEVFYKYPDSQVTIENTDL